ncbi:CYTH and CHAD domain-containing protein [Asanoa sp. WMMD1127]|uniref:CYTH and CHAD domain-containing protein n=1 Tax=Asanoa sp. WMMD1127 TaxID=3016107 RepID=UPI002417051F|nr:CYTH and CHAD domain-containing protein [Asanoa sp. WMMD1127]MDG4823518.1 CYTH and CHAD domain-containing protein [Asanoa sp. WMMD1127]
MLEEERKLGADDAFRLPDLGDRAPAGGRVVEAPAATLTATYYDTPDLRLARAGVSLRHRKGDAAPWTVKLPAAVPGLRHEISRKGRAGNPPAELVALVTAWSRGAALAPAAKIRTERRAYEVRDAEGTVLAEVADDAVTVFDGKAVRMAFREIEVERKAGDRGLLDTVTAALTEAGAVEGEFTPKHVRALGKAAALPPDLTPPGDLPEQPSAADVVVAAVRSGVGRILAHDPLVRLGQPLDDGDTAVHQMRVGCRRLRSDLRTFAALLDRGWADRLRDELRWIAGVLGAARDAEVLRERLGHTANADPLCPIDPAAVARLDAALDARQRTALAEVDEALRSPRYHALLDLLVDAAREPRVTASADAPALRLLPRMVAKPWRRLAYGAKGVDGAADLDPLAPDERWHAVRINGKRARYAVDAVASVIGGPAAKLAKALGRVQNLLGEHQDAAVAADTWVALAAESPGDTELAAVAGRLFERERAAIRAARAAFPEAWAVAAEPTRTRWLP